MYMVVAITVEKIGVFLCYCCLPMYCINSVIVTLRVKLLLLSNLNAVLETYPLVYVTCPIIISPLPLIVAGLHTFDT